MPADDPEDAGDDRTPPEDPGERPDDPRAPVDETADGPASDREGGSADETADGSASDHEGGVSDEGDANTVPGGDPADGAADESGTPAPGQGGKRESRPSPAGEGDDGEHNDLTDFVREVVTSVGTVLVVGALLFAASGVWPPLVAVESGSMEPHMSKGDLVFVAENGRYAPGDAVRGVVTFQQGQQNGYWSFGSHGNVVVFQPDGRARTPVIHRARIYVEEGENWVERADPEYLGNQQTCAENVHCPADHDGFITRGDNNPRYDQVGSTEASTLSDVVKPEWIRGNAKVRLPKLGCIRLELSGIGCEYPLVG